MEEVSKQSNVQAVAWILMAGFGQIYSENYKQKAVPNDVKLGQKERTCTAGI